MKKYLVIAITIFTTSICSYSQVLKEDLLSFEQSYTLEKEGEYVEAISTLKNTYKENSYEYNLRLGWLDYLAGQYTESSSYYNKAISLKPMSIEALYGSIYPLLGLGKIGKIEKTYLKILNISSMETQANYRLGLMYYEQKKYKEAEKYIKTIINLYPFDYDTMILLAWNYLQMGKKTEARLLFQKVLMNNPSDASALEGLRILN